MGDEVNIIYDRVGAIAEGADQAKEAVEQGRTILSRTPTPVTYVPVPSVPGSNAFGNSEKALSCGSSYADLQAAADEAAEALAGVLTRDAGRLRQVVKVFKELDHETADRLLGSASKSLDVYSAHVHSHGLHKYDDPVRAGQIDTLHRAVDGPSLIGADLNAATNNGAHNTRKVSLDAINSFNREGYTVYTGATNADGDVVGTSPSGTRIDYVISSPGVELAGAPQLVDGGTSDHDGQQVDVVVPDW
ncbi:hypothetical protein ACWENQ_17220 [Nonomuraea sp. NPDC004354]